MMKAETLMVVLEVVTAFTLMTVLATRRATVARRRGGRGEG
jgi:hypothetical protein